MEMLDDNGYEPTIENLITLKESIAGEIEILDVIRKNKRKKEFLNKGVYKNSTILGR